MLTDEVGIGKDTVRKIVVEDFRKPKICSRFVPQSLTPEQKDRRTAACQRMIAKTDSDPEFFKNFVAGDETWSFAYDPTNKRQSAAWVGETSPRPCCNISRRLVEISHTNQKEKHFARCTVFKSLFKPLFSLPNLLSLR
jgi:hypothetical protein